MRIPILNEILSTYEFEISCLVQSFLNEIPKNLDIICVIQQEIRNRVSTCKWG